MCRNTAKCKRLRNVVLVGAGLALLLGLAIGYSAPAVKEWSAGPCTVDGASVGSDGSCTLHVVWAGNGGIPLSTPAGEVYPRLNASAPCASYVGTALTCWMSRYDIAAYTGAAAVDPFVPAAGPCFGADATPMHSSTGAFRVAFGLAFGLCFGLLLMSCCIYNTTSRGAHAVEALCRGRLECCARAPGPSTCPSVRDLAAAVSAVLGLVLALALGLGYAMPAASNFVSTPCNVTSAVGTREYCALSVAFAQYWQAHVDLATVVPAQSAMQCETASGRAALCGLAETCWYIPSAMTAAVASLTVPSGFACPHALARDLNYQLSRQANTWTGEFFVRPDVPPVSLSATASFRVNFGGWFGGVVGGLMTLPWLYLSIGRIRGKINARRAARMRAALAHAQPERLAANRAVVAGAARRLDDGSGGAAEAAQVQLDVAPAVAPLHGAALAEAALPPHARGNIQITRGTKRDMTIVV